MRGWWFVMACISGLILASCRPAEPPPAAAPGPASAAAPAASTAPSTAPGAAASAPAPAATPATVEKLNFAYVAPSEWMTIPWIAKESGIFAKHGFDVSLQLVGGTPRLVQSLIAGDFDYAIVGGTAVLQARLQNADTVILASSGSYFPFKLMAHPDAGAHTVADLRGKVVAVSQVGSTSHAFLRVLLSRAGLTGDDITLLQAGSNPQAATALVTGNIAAATVSGVMVPTVQRAGGIMLADGKVLRIPEPNAVVASTRRRVDRDPASTRRLLEAYVEAVHFFKTQREASIAIMQQYMSGLAYDETAYLYDDVVDDYQRLPLPNVDSIQAGLERDVDAPLGDLKVTDFYDSRFLEEIDRSGLVTTLYQ